MIRVTVDESVQQREKKIRDELKQAKRAIVASCSDGILIATHNNLRKPKIKQVSGPVAFVGVGIWSDFNRLWEFACSSLNAYRFVHASERDFTVLDKIIETICREIRQKFINLFGADYYQCELVFAFLGEEVSKDRLYMIDCVGIEDADSSRFIIPANGIVHKNLDVIDGLVTMKEALHIAVDVLQDGPSRNLRNLEVAILSRSILQEGRREDAYHKLSVQEVNEWLTPQT